MTPWPDHASDPEWLGGGAAQDDVVLSSRVRLARNISSFRFMIRASRAESARLVERVGEVVRADTFPEKVAWIELHHASPADRALCVERHLISIQHSRGKQSNGIGGLDEPRALAASVPGEQLAIMVNEEDHLRIQAIRAGLNLEDAFERANRADDVLDEALGFAFSPRLGYLTACPTNVGTGARFSVMLHLVGLRLLGEVDKLKRAASDMSLAVRGFLGEGSEPSGDFHQLSNQVTLGKEERAILDEFRGAILPRIIEYERAARRKLLSTRRAVVEDQVHRAVGTLRSARLMTSEEAMQLLSLARFGATAGLVDLDARSVTRLFLTVQSEHLQRTVGRRLSQEDRQVERATVLRRALGG